MRSREWERRTILLFLLTLVAALAFDDRPPVTLALPLSASATLLGRVIAFYFPKQRGERLANKAIGGSAE
jgi:hypothetical protein